MSHNLDTLLERLPLDSGRRIPLTHGANGELPRVRPIDAAAAAMAALRDPIGYPPLAQSIVPGDSVAIAVDSAVPSSLEIVQGTIELLASAGVDRGAISIVVASTQLAELLRTAPGGKGTSGVPIVLHDPDDERNLCFVGLNKRHEPLVVNRTIYDADLVLSIGLARPRGRAFTNLFPQFSSIAVIERFRTPANSDSAVERKAQRGEIGEAGRLIGAAMEMLVVPGPGDTVADVVAGEPISVARHGAELYRQQWSRRSPQQVSLVIATVSGGALGQSWTNVARALVRARRLVSDGGAVALCTNLDRPVGESMSRLVGSSELRRVARKVFHEHAEDSWAAWQLARAISGGPVYLLSELEADMVEELGLAPVSDIDELVRLAGRHDSVIVLEDAQYAVPVVEGEEANG